jgi:hypothetical protein
MSAWQDILGPRAGRPEFLGLELEPFPFISGFGIAFRIYRLSCLEPKDLFPVLGIRASTEASLLQACHRPGVSRTRFEDRIGLHGTRAPSYWNMRAWSPLDLHGHWDGEELPLRHCPRCALYGYHCALFQLPSIERCPWHGCPLRERCEQCDRPYASHVTAALDLGRCACGHDLFDSNVAGTTMWQFPNENALAALEDYLAWATTERSRRHFLTPYDESVARTGFAALARPPMHWNRTARDREATITTYTADSSVPSPGAFWGWSLLGADRPLTLTRLSTSTHCRLAEISRSRFDMRPLQAANTAMIEKFIPPLDVAPGANHWLQLSAVDPRALHTCARLTDAVCEYIGDRDELDVCRSPAAQKSNALDSIAGRGHLARALEDVLVKGFEQGLDALCRVHFNQASQTRTWVAPMAEIVGCKGCLEEVRVAWTAAAPLVAEPTPETKTTRKSRAKKAQAARGMPRSARHINSKRRAKRCV